MRFGFALIYLLFKLFLVSSFVEPLEFIFKIPGVTSFLSAKLCQDPLEKFFGVQRQRGGTSDNPSVKEFCKNTQALRVINGACLNIQKGNCRGNHSTMNRKVHLNLKGLASNMLQFFKQH